MANGKEVVKNKTVKSTNKGSVNRYIPSTVKGNVQKDSSSSNYSSPTSSSKKNASAMNNLGKIEFRLSAIEESNNESRSLYNCFKDRRKSVFWSKEEEAFLIEGIKKHGKGNWKCILEDYKSKFNEKRRYRDLSDKVRVLENESSYKKQPRMEYFEVDQADEPIRNLMGEKIIYYCKFPNEAAAKAAKTKAISFEERIIKICSELANEKWFHIYRAYRRGGRIRVRKISGRSIYRKDGV